MCSGFIPPKKSTLGNPHLPFSPKAIVALHSISSRRRIAEDRTAIAHYKRHVRINIEAVAAVSSTGSDAAEKQLFTTIRTYSRKTGPCML
jgi:hypothetical protein